MIINAIIVDDEPLARKGLNHYIDDIAFMQLMNEFDHALAAIDFLQSNPVDVVFLDINMPEVNGLEMARSLQKPPLIVFTTAYREFATDSYDLGGFDYLVKPITFERFLKTCNRLHKHLTANRAGAQVINEKEDHFFIKEDGTLLKIVIDQVHYIEGLKDYVKIILDQKVHLALISLKAVAEKLPSNKFIRVHKSYLINKNRIDAIEGNMLSIGNHKIPIGRTFRDAVIKEIIGENLWRRHKED